MPFAFTFDNLEFQFKTALDQGYCFCTCADYVKKKKEGEINKLIVNRVDIDFSVKKASRLGEIFNRLGIKGSFFVRLHAKEYNPFSFENYRIIKELIESGHEIGYHSEVVDQSAIWNESARRCLKRDIAVINAMFDINIAGVASHGGMTGLNNLDFWSDNDSAEFGLLYEAYDKKEPFNLFEDSLYLTDSEWTRWKCYNHGRLVEGDRRNLEEHLFDGHNLIYLLIHSDTYFDKHFYE